MMKQDIIAAYSLIQKQEEYREIIKKIHKNKTLEVYDEEEFMLFEVPFFLRSGMIEVMEREIKSINEKLQKEYNIRMTDESFSI